MRDLSLLCITKGEDCTRSNIESMAHLSEILGTELVIVADGKEAYDRLITLFEAGSNLFRLDSQGYLESIHDQAVDLCSGKYVLRLDDDESIPDQLVLWLLAGNYHRCDHWKFSRIHLWHDESHCIVNPPLWPDHQTRLSVKEKAKGRNSIHCGSPYGGGELAPFPIIHHKFLVKDREARISIVRRYDKLVSGAGTCFLPFSLPEDVWTPDKLDIRTVDSMIISNQVSCAVDLGFSIGMHQMRDEIEPFVQWLLTEIKPRNVIEIGTLHGGTASLWSQIVTGKVISVDLPSGRFGGADHNYDRSKCRLRDVELMSKFSNLTMVSGDSHDDQTLDTIESCLNGENVDLLFIDGDHTIDGVRQDYEMYKEFVRPGGVIAFHDILDTPLHRNAGCEVNLLWDDLVVQQSELNKGYHTFLVNGPWGGIGALVV